MRSKSLVDTFSSFHVIDKHSLCMCILREECRMRRTFGPKRDENAEWRRLHNEELPCLYRSTNKVRVIKSRRLR